MRTMGSNLRAILLHVDHKLWCYAAVWLGETWNGVLRDYPRAPQYNGMAPLDACRTHGLEPKDWKPRITGQPEYARRFGCLAYAQVQPADKVKKIDAKFKKCVFVGYSTSGNSAWLCGSYFEDKKYSCGYRWDEIETLSVKFREHIMVNDLDQLLPGTKDEFVLGENLELSVLRDPSVRKEQVVQGVQPGAPTLQTLRCPVESMAGGSVVRSEEDRRKEGQF